MSERCADNFKSSEQESIRCQLQAGHKGEHMASWEWGEEERKEEQRECTCQGFKRNHYCPVHRPTPQGLAKPVRTNLRVGDSMTSVRKNLSRRG